MRLKTPITIAALSAVVVGTMWAQTITAKPAAPRGAAASLPCGDGVANNFATKVRKHDDSVRASAQKGLNFLTEATLAWQKANDCMGCHVQGVTGEALAVGRHHQYEVADKDLDAVFMGILSLPGGLRRADQISHSEKGASLAFGGASLARYDKWVDEKYGDDLMKVASDLLAEQGETGEIVKAANRGIAKGPLQVTYQAIQTWQQAYGRSADDRWLTAIAKAEGYIQNQVQGWGKAPTADLQHVNYALLGLLAAGIGANEKVAVRLRDTLLAAQQKDGGFPEATTGGTSSPLATGQTLYTLRQLGMNDSDAPVSAAAMYLIEAQKPNGGWSDTGAEKAEAMWAVLGLVSTDILSVNVAGLKNGQHIDGLAVLRATATDNEGGGVRKIEIALDDELVGGACSDEGAHTFDANKLTAGMHTIDVTAFSKSGNTATRRLIVYAGDHYISNVGTKYVDGGTLLSLRDIAPTTMKHTVELQILDKGKRLHSIKQAGQQGALAFHWTGQTGDGTAKRGEYTARLRIIDATGKTRQTHDMPFVHDTPDVQARDYAQVTGRIQFADGDKDVQNATVELIDESGNVVQSTQSTGSGSYRFRNVTAKKKYKVRVKKNGRADREAELAPAEAAAEQAIDFEL